MVLTRTHLLGVVSFTLIFCTGPLISFTPVLQLFCWVLYSKALLLANGAFACACALSMSYLIQEVQLKRKRFLPIFFHLPALERLDTLCYQSVIIGLSLSALGLLTTLLLHGNHHSDWSYQMSSTYGVWLVYLFQLFVRFVLCRRGRKSAYLSITSFSILLFLHSSSQW